jgi:hypothetical protein
MEIDASINSLSKEKVDLPLGNDLEVSPEVKRILGKLGLGAPPPTPSGKPEFTDGTNWYYLATENWVINSLSKAGESPCAAATITNLTSTYNNGASGVGATLTATVNGAFALDGISNLGVNARVLVKNQTQQLQNGIYRLTSLGTASTPWVLTRSPDYDTPSQLNTGEVVFVSSGNQNQATGWMLVSTVLAVGTGPVIFQQLDSGAIVSVLGTTNQITVTTANDTATVSLANNPVIPGTASMTMPAGSTAQRPPTLVAGMIRYNNGL